MKYELVSTETGKSTPIRGNGMPKLSPKNIFGVFSFHPANPDTVGSYISHILEDAKGNKFFINTETPPTSPQINSFDILLRLASNSKHTLQEFEQFVSIETKIGSIKANGERVETAALKKAVRVNASTWSDDVKKN